MANDVSHAYNLLNLLSCVVDVRHCHAWRRDYTFSTILLPLKIGLKMCDVKSLITTVVILQLDGESLFKYNFCCILAA